MQLAGAAVLISTIIVWLFVQEPNKTKPTEKTSLMQDFLIAVRSPVQLSVLYAVFLAWVFGASISPYLALHLTKLNSGGPQWLVGLIFSLPSLGFLLMAHRWTRLGERWGFERSILIGFVGGGFCALSLAFAGSILTFAALYFVTGLWLAAIGPCTAAITCVQVDESFRGRAYGIQQSAGTFGALLAPLAAARLVASYGTRSVFLMVGALFLAGAPVFQALVRRWTKEKCDVA